MTAAPKIQNHFESDLVVIGSGIAGVAAALAGRHRGWSVQVLSTGPGATGISAGPWDLGLPVEPDVSLEAGLQRPAWDRLRNTILKEEFV